MTLAQFIVTYAICWWLILFMLLPIGAKPVQNPERGHAPSAPENPRLRRKFGWTTVIAIVPAVLLYFVANAAKAEDGVYHVGGGCEPLTTHVPSADIAARDGYGASGRKVAPAELESAAGFDDMKSVKIPLHIPSAEYLDEERYNADLSESFLQAGEMEVGMGGDVTLNGRPINHSQIFDASCPPRN